MSNAKTTPLLSPGTEPLRRVRDAMAWMEERAKNSTSFGSHCHAYEVAARHLKLAMDGDDVVPPPAAVCVEALLLEIIGHLGASIIQSVPTDDQIIMDHVKAAHELAKSARRQLKVPA